VDSKIAAPALAHVPPGVEKVYDRHHYLPERRLGNAKFKRQCVSDFTFRT
jgi:hypothetical protein